MEDLRDVLLGVLIEIIAHFLIKEIERKPDRRGQPKHMRKG